MLQELRFYARVAAALEPPTREFRFVSELLHVFEARLMKTLRVTKTPQLRSALRKTIRGVRMNQRDLISNRKSLANSPQRSLGVIENFFNEKPRTRLLKRRIDLDNQLQVQLAKVLLFHLPKLSVKTLARLIVLAYWAADLAAESEEKGYLKIRTTERALTVRSVYDKLKSAKLQPNEMPDDEISKLRRLRINRLFVRARGTNF
jgi:hypothetical protein